MIWMLRRVNLRIANKIKIMSLTMTALCYHARQPSKQRICVQHTILCTRLNSRLARNRRRMTMLLLATMKPWQRR